MSPLPGVRSVMVDWVAGRAWVIYDPVKQSTDGMVKAVPQPYRARLLSDDTYEP
ncbi:MAG: hypothetical protein HYX92_08455 [Chloroflexi bacterium]|nr:hypothetical protein [Chloroflexota bacterium]